MRRPRSKLQVSTFPFLAVLLCAMGSLLLLLFIMDRRAKIAARYRVAEELQARQSRTKAEEEARQAEWEKAKEQLHLALLQQQDQLKADAQGVQRNLNDASKKLAIVQTRRADLDKDINTEASKIVALQLDIAGRRAGLQQADKKETRSKAELIEAVKQLAELERAFQHLRALKEREKQTYSVVPYRGKRGDARPPIYVECVGQGVLFHPEKKLLQASDFTPEAVRGEVERRHGPLAVQKAGKDKVKPPRDEPEGPYLLFLVRPDGIVNYYKAMASLKGYQLDFGYELVDEGWTLDFPGDTSVKNAPPCRPAVPWKHAEEVRSIVTPARPDLVGNGPSKEGTLVALPPSGGSTPGSLGPPSLATKSPSGFVSGAPGFGAGNTNAGAPIPQPPRPGSSEIGIPFRAPPPTGNPSYKGVDAGISAKPPMFVPIATNPALVPIASAGNPDTTGNPATPSVGGNADGTGQAAKLPGGGSSTSVNPINVPPPGGTVAGQRSGTASNSSDGTAMTGNGTPGESGGSPGDSRGKTLPTFGADNGKKPLPASPLSKLLGNKDFVIIIECHGDHVTITPGSKTYRWTTANLQETDQALAQAVANLIARRQASVRPGEPPYRPLIRFQVSNEGLRTYYHVYPLLEQLRVPMTRENVAE
jgi:hypothetical protein